MNKHLDEARREALRALEALLAGNPQFERAVLINDVFGKISVVVWGPAAEKDKALRLATEALHESITTFWSGDVWYATTGAPAEAGVADALVYQKAWDDGVPLGAGGRLRLADRHRSRTAWFRAAAEPPWKAVGLDAGPPIVVFYSFKGGVGRTTALAAFAINKARAGEHVAVVDMDLDAPGVATLLAADQRGTVAPWGAVDYFLERRQENLEFRDYYHACRREAVTGKGEILVVPAGTLEPDRDYLGKLSRVDFDAPWDPLGPHYLTQLLEQIRSELRPQWLLLDARAGLSEPAGLLLGGTAHLHVLFGTSSEQSWHGLRLVLDRIGGSRVREGQSQQECVLVHAMVAEDPQVAERAKAAFADRARDEFASHYYAPDPDDPDEDEMWFVRDSEDSDAPHVPVPVSYQPRLAHFEVIDSVADALANSTEYGALADRITSRFLKSEV